jgi:hypothetical protein
MGALRQVQLKSLWVGKSPLRIAGNLLLLLLISAATIVVGILPLNLSESSDPKLPTWMTVFILAIILIAAGLLWWL